MELKPKNKTAIFTVGYPASGKTTFLDLFNLHKLIDSDKYVGDYQARSNYAVSMIKNAIKNADNLTVASTGGSGVLFVETINCLKNEGYKIVMLHFNTNREVCDKRNNNRKNPVPSDAFTHICDTIDKYLVSYKQLADAWFTIIGGMCEEK